MPAETINKITSDILAKHGLKVDVNGQNTRGLREGDRMRPGVISQHPAGLEGALISTSKEKDKVFTQIIIKSDSNIKNGRWE